MTMTERQKLSVDRARKDYTDEVDVAVFKASFDENTRVLVYPYKQRDGFLWTLWIGFDWDFITEAIKAGGRVRGSLKDAALVAVEELLAHDAGETADGEKK